VQVTQRTHLDLESGWRLTAVTPLTRRSATEPWRYGRATGKGELSGQTLNLTVTLDPGQQFGFETARYRVTPRGLAFDSASRNLEGVEGAASRPILELIPAGTAKQKLRLLFLTRASDAEYNLALLSARDLAALEAFTAAVRAAPDAACQVEERRWCVWAPPGVALRAKRPVNGRFQPVL
jgi:hypothetical protein